MCLGYLSCLGNGLRFYPVHASTYLPDYLFIRRHETVRLAQMIDYIINYPNPEDTGRKLHELKVEVARQLLRHESAVLAQQGTKPYTRAGRRKLNRVTVMIAKKVGLL